MAAHWSEQYVARPPRADLDCGDLVREVMRDQFGRDVPLPSPRATGVRGRDAQIAATAATLADPTDDPREGDLVLMRAAGRTSDVGHHAGVYCVVDGRAHALHRMQGAGTCLHALDALPRHGLELAGTYRWR